MEPNQAADRSRRGGASGRRAQRAAEARAGDAGSGPSVTADDPSAVWSSFCAREAKVTSANLQLRHFLGDLDGLSVGQVETLQEMVRSLGLRLEECRVHLARAQEREAVTAHIALQLERGSGLVGATLTAAGGGTSGPSAVTLPRTAEEATGSKVLRLIVRTQARFRGIKARAEVRLLMTRPTCPKVVCA